jgi:protease IV
VKAFIRNFFAALLAIIVIFVVVIGVLAAKSGKKEKIENHSWLVLDLYGDIPEYAPPADPMAMLMGGDAETLQDLLDNLTKASVDKRIKGVIVKISASNSLGLAKLQELRSGVAKVRAADKPVYAYSDGLSKGSYYLAVACDSIFMPPTAYIEFTGLGATSTHVKRTLDKIGVRPNLHRIKEYKSAAEIAMREDMSPEAKENVLWIMDEYWQVIMADLQADRGLSEERVTSLMEHAMFTPDEAKDAGMIDEVLYWDELESKLKGEDDEELRTVSSDRYADVSFDKVGLKGKKTIAVVHAQGLIAGRESTINPLLGMVMGHETVVGDLRRVTKDEDVVAVIFRVESGGGENLASDLIGHQVEVTSREKPIVASMVDQAASGGYQIAFRASKIIALPLTITGSIGSISGKMNVAGLHEKLGITHDSVTKGPNALMWSPYADFTEAERARFEDDHWKSFNLWLSRVAEKRGMSFAEAEKLAYGRVWTGRQAVANHLIDEVGGLDRAIEIAKDLANVPADEKVKIVHYPEQQGIMDMILGGGDTTMTVKWMIYRFIHEDLAASWDLVAAKLVGSPRMNLMEDLPIR